MPKPAPTPPPTLLAAALASAREQLSKPMPPLAVAGIAVAAMAVGTWIGTSGALSPAPRPQAAATVDVDRAAVEKIVADTIRRNPTVVRDIVKDFVLTNPEVMRQALAEVIKNAAGKPAAAPAAAPVAAAARPAAPDQSAAIKSNAALLFSSPRDIALGNVKGDVTLVEFFDYNCGFCKRALADKASLISADPKLKIVIKDFPVLGQGSVEAARVAIAVRMQDPSKVPEFHRIMLSSPRADKASALAVAKDLGLDVARVEADMAAREVSATIEENVTLARTLGINGTPSYVVAEQVVVGAVGHAALADRIRQARR